MATAELIERGYLGNLPRPSLLAPYIIETISDGQAPDGIALPTLLEPFPEVWIHQQEHLSRS